MKPEYRVVRKTIYNGHEETDIDFIICQVFYNVFGDVRFIDTGSALRASGLDGLVLMYEEMGKALDRPVLDFNSRKDLADSELYVV